MIGGHCYLTSAESIKHSSMEGDVVPAKTKVKVIITPSVLVHMICITLI